jgi:uncharacterized protein YdeI (YjbR/CyaY-like superfamily)
VKRTEGEQELEVPSDLQAALAAYPAAAANFDAFPRSVKRNVLEWILIAKKTGDSCCPR